MSASHLISEQLTRAGELLHRAGGALVQHRPLRVVGWRGHLAAEDRLAVGLACLATSLSVQEARDHAMSPLAAC